MKDSKVIRDPKAFQLLADETRMKMIYLLRAKESTVSQIAAELGLTPQTIYHHVKKLRESDMVEVSREERVDHLVESYYRATAGLFHFVNGGCAGQCTGKDAIKKALTALGNLGYDVDVGSATVKGISKAMEELRRHREDPDIITKVYEMDDLDPFITRDVIEFAIMMTMSDRDFDRYIGAQCTLRTRLLSWSIGED